MSALEAARIIVRADGHLLVDGVDVVAPAGAVTGLIGPNGAGKSTLLRALAAIERPDAGAVRFGDDDLLALRRRDRARLAALVEQDASTDLPLTVRDTVALGRLPHQSVFGADDAESARVVAESLDAVGMASFAERDVTSLSGGERQRVLLAKALAQRTPLLLLDEPTNHLDIAGQLGTLALLDRLAASGVAVLAALHDLTLAAAHCAQLVVLAGGRVVAAGPTREVLTPDLVERVYGVRAAVLENPLTGAPVVAFAPHSTDQEDA
ncbi:iron complex transport system ATP-binding protein [Diaminobutyricimonas aerilata]|uniref:Iron complex transport system ATP-binding protein n=1 Tax=Diaminobutyricimonas aerilata TaxID=1162967 RepID=A0A2M9CIH5_9MICO|nr:ATP-binding cassette domain-containing protein [Diaminobutyricimonas aerilata]PJJ71711.1 iron complex transport system ATP-binding protein [Diaminobutyricimonas aerilata]